MNFAELMPVLGNNGIVLFLIIIADIILRGTALWFSARAERKGWFIALLLINTMGILPLFYLLYYKHIDLTKIMGSMKKNKKKK